MAAAILCKVLYDRRSMTEVRNIPERHSATAMNGKSALGAAEALGDAARDGHFELHMLIRLHHQQDPEDQGKQADEAGQRRTQAKAPIPPLNIIPAPKNIARTILMMCSPPNTTIDCAA